MYLIRMQVIKKLLSELSYDNKTREKTSKHYISIYPEKLYSHLSCQTYTHPLQMYKNIFPPLQKYE